MPTKGPETHKPGELTTLLEGPGVPRPKARKPKDPRLQGSLILTWRFMGTDNPTETSTSNPLRGLRGVFEGFSGFFPPLKGPKPQKPRTLS